MKRFFPLNVDRLEDRCVPTADITEVSTLVISDDSSTTEVVVVESTSDPVLATDDDSSATTDDSTTDTTESYWTNPDEPVEPVDDPYWP